MQDAVRLQIQDTVRLQAQDAVRLQPQDAVRLQMIQEVRIMGIARRTGKMQPKKKDAQDQEDAYERCVCCHRRVDIFKNTDIEFRAFYVEGAGQLCYGCYHELYAQNAGG